jgi:hypothetical protein
MDLGSSRSVETYRRHASIMGFICDRSMINADSYHKSRLTIHRYFS